MRPTGYFCIIFLSIDVNKDYSEDDENLCAPPPSTFTNSTAESRKFCSDIELSELYLSKNPISDRKLKSFYV